MATSTYLTICNNSILEAGTDLAFFASDGSDFNSPPTIQHTRFKKWVRDAWRDIQQSAPDWHFSVHQGQLRLHPRIMWDGTGNVQNLITGVPVNTPWTIQPVGETTILQTINTVDFKILAEGPLSPYSYARGYVDLSGDEADAITFPLDSGSTYLVYLQDPAPSPADFFSGIVSGWGSYDFSETTQEDVTSPFPYPIKQINQTTFRLSDYGATVAEGAGNGNEKQLRFVPWESFQDRGYDLSSNTPGEPVYVTQDFEGRFRFYPPLNKDYEISFDYEEGVQMLSAYSDIPEGLPEEFVDLIMWKALQYYGQYDEQPSISNTQGTGRADRNVKIMQQRLERQTREKFHFKPAKLW